MRSVFDLYDRPGSYLVEHPNARHAIVKRVACLASVAALVAPAAVSAAPNHSDPRFNPGGVQHYVPQGTRGVSAF